MKTLFYFLIILLSIKSVSSQTINTTYNDAIEIKKRILIVGLPEEDKSFISEYENENPNFIELYRNDLNGQKKAFQEVVLAHWKFSDSIIVLPIKEAKSLMKKNPDKYTILRYAELVPDRSYVKINYHEPPVTSWNLINGSYLYSSQSRYDCRNLSITSLVIELPKRTIEVFLPKMSPSKGDFIFVLNHMEYILSDLLKSKDNTAKNIYSKINQSAEQLKNKTLLLDINELDRKQGLNDLDEIKKYYPYPVKLTDYKTLEKVLIEGDTNYVVATNSRFDFHNSEYYLSNAGNGTIYTYFTGPTFEYGQIDPNQYSIRIYYPAINSLQLQRFTIGK
jgi:hypothetical protein